MWRLSCSDSEEEEDEMPAMLKLDEVKRLVGQLDELEKIDLYRSLRKSILLSRYKQLAEKTGDIPIALDDITEAVEAVRSQQCLNG